MPLSDDVLYLSLLVGSIALGKILRPLEAKARIWVSTFAGLAIVFSVSGIHGLHCVLSLVIQILILKAVPMSMVHVVSFVVQFGYLIFFRLAMTPPPHTNAIQMIMTLKYIGVAFEIFDTSKLRREAKTDVGQDGDEERRNNELKLKYKAVDPGPVDIFHYAFSHAGILTGPYYSYRTFSDSYNSSFSSSADCDGAMVRRLSRVPMYIALFLISGHLFPIEAVEMSTFYETTSFAYRVFYMTPVFFNFRMRLYSGFVLSECSCIMAGVGAYPEASDPKSGNGPTKYDALEKINEKSDVSYNFETVHNIDEWGAESVSTMRKAMKTWNMTVQYWLSDIVYRRVQGPKGPRTILVMLISAVWHGIYPGYYLCLGSVPFILMVEDLYERIMRRKLSEKGQAAYDWLAWFMRMQWFSYLGMAFRLLTIDLTLNFWSSIFYLGHIILPAFYLIGLVLFAPMLK